MNFECWIGNTRLANSSTKVSSVFEYEKQTGDIPNSQLVGGIPVSVRPTSSSSANSYFGYLSLTLPMVYTALRHTETISGAAWIPA